MGTVDWRQLSAAPYDLPAPRPCWELLISAPSVLVSVLSAEQEQQSQMLAGLPGCALPAPCHTPTMCATVC